MRTINVSTEVFAEIWKRHRAGDRAEDDILRHVLDLPSGSPEAAEPVQSVVTSALPEGYADARYGVCVPEGFEIFRIYKGREYRARATHGNWLLLNDNSTYASLNKLNWAVVRGSENAWYCWKYREENGGENFVHALRDQTKVQVRV